MSYYRDLEDAEAAFIAATRALNRLRVERGLEHLSAKDLASLDNRSEGGEEGQTKSDGESDPTAHDATPSEYQRFYDFVVQADPAIVDAWHFTENNKPGGLAEQVRNSLKEINHG